MLSSKRKTIFIRALRGRADVYNHIGNYDRAIADYKMLVNFYAGEEQNGEPNKLDVEIELANIIGKVQGDFKKAISLLNDVLAIAHNRKNPDIAAKCMKIMGNLHRRKGDYREALEYYRRSLSAYKNKKNSIDLGTIYNNFGVIYHDLGKIKTALNYYRKCYEILDKLKDRRRLCIVSNNIGIIYLDKGELELAMKYYKKYLLTSREIGYKTGTASALGNIGMVYQIKGELKRALDYYRKDLVISQEIGHPWGIAISFANLASTYLDMGNYKRALAYYNKCLAISKKSGLKSIAGIAFLGLSIVYREMGQFRNSKELIKKAEKVYKKMGEIAKLSEVYSNVVELLIAEGKIKKAVDSARKALMFAEKAGAREPRIIALVEMGKALVKKESDRGISYLKEAISSAKKGKIIFELGIAYYELAVALSKKKRDHRFIKTLEMSEEIFSKAGANGWLKKILVLKRMKKNLTFRECLHIIII